MSKNAPVRDKFKKSPVEGLFGSGTFIPGVPVKVEHLALCPVKATVLQEQLVELIVDHMVVEHQVPLALPQPPLAARRLPLPPSQPPLPSL